MRSEEEVPAFAFQFKENAKEFIDFILSLSHIYNFEMRDNEIILIQQDKRLPYYDDQIKLYKGDYLVPVNIMNDDVIFTVFPKEIFEQTYLVGRA